MKPPLVLRQSDEPLSFTVPRDRTALKPVTRLEALRKKAGEPFALGELEPFSGLLIHQIIKARFRLTNLLYIHCAAPASPRLTGPTCRNLVQSC